VSELILPICPICQAPGSLFSQSRQAHGRTYTWYECEACASVLLSTGEGQWTYQQIGREEMAHLLKQPLTVADLLALLPQMEEAAPAPGRDVEPVEAPAEEAEPAIPVYDEWSAAPAEEAEPATPVYDKWSTEPAEEAVPTAPAYDEWSAEPAEEAAPTFPFRAGVIRERVEEARPATSLRADTAEEPVTADRSIRVIRRLIPWLLLLCLIGIVTLVGIVVYGMVTGSISVPILSP
jgi:hypothetical protein